MEKRFNFEFDAEHLPKFREWIATRGGVIVWENQEIGGGAAREVMTPALTEDGAPYPPPNWRYGKPLLLDVDSAIVGTFTVLEKFRGRVKKFYWGMGLAAATEAKAEKLCELRRLRSPSSKFEYRYTFDFDYGATYAQVEIGEIVRELLRNMA